MRIRIRGAKYQTKTAIKNILILKPKSELLKNKILRIFLFLNGSSSFRININKKREKKISVNFKKNVHDLDPNSFFPVGIQNPGSRSVSKLNGSLTLLLILIFNFNLQQASAELQEPLRQNLQDLEPDEKKRIFAFDIFKINFFH